MTVPPTPTFRGVWPAWGHVVSLPYGYPSPTSTKSLYLSKAGGARHNASAAGYLMRRPGWILEHTWIVDVNSVGGTGDIQLRLIANNVALVNQDETVAVGNSQYFTYRYHRGEYTFDAGDRVGAVRANVDLTVQTDDITCLVLVEYRDVR